MILLFVLSLKNIIEKKKSKQIEIIGGFPLLANTSVLKDINKDFERLDRKVFFHSSNEFFIKLKIHFLFRFKFRGEICNNNFFFLDKLGKRKIKKMNKKMKIMMKKMKKMIIEKLRKSFMK